eukprot:TRINITY_DN9072_c0_g1_i1.p1 TRINITY_DN9072_c0_g1~~TRINITY_DN9072_c0_g1_i1.p1  ORF type:complete len:107 (-),score=12.93 TRINITY_DN9072_c0_g1_i1:16-336(-)
MIGPASGAEPTAAAAVLCATVARYTRWHLPPPQSPHLTPPSPVLRSRLADAAAAVAAALKHFSSTAALVLPRFSRRMETCNSHYVSQLAAFFIVTRTEISTVKSKT